MSAVISQRLRLYRSSSSSVSPRAGNNYRLLSLLLFPRAKARPSSPLLSSSSSSAAPRNHPTNRDDHLLEVSHGGEVGNSPEPSNGKILAESCASGVSSFRHDFSVFISDYPSEGSQSAKALNVNQIMEKLERYGVAGVLSYGLFNTAYYLITFLVVWFYVAPAPARLGYMAAVKRFIKVMAMVWAGSQVTKLIRAGGALALAPLVDKWLTWFTNKFKFKSKAKAFGTIVALCFGLALLVFVVLTVLWA